MRLTRIPLFEETLNEMAKRSFTAYHGSPSEIKKFTIDNVGREEATDQEGPGIYLTSSYNDAAVYGKYVHKIKVKSGNFYDESERFSKMRPKILAIMKMAKDWKETAENFDENPNKGILVALDSFMQYSQNEKDLLQSVWHDFYRYAPVDFVRNCVKNGIDGIVVKREQGGENVEHIIIYNADLIEIEEVIPRT